MINLIPPIGTRTVRREYVLRVAAAWCFIVGAALFANAAMLIPTRVLLTKQVDPAGAPTQEGSGAEAEYTRISQELGKTRSLTDQLTRAEAPVLVSDIVRHIESSRSASISIDQIQIQSGAKKNSVEASGSAATREALRVFVDALKRDAFFLDATVPVSDLARDVNPSFNVTLTLKETE